jgi:hypothetical protein
MIFNVLKPCFFIDKQNYKFYMIPLYVLTLYTKKY